MPSGNPLFATKSVDQLRSRRGGLARAQAHADRDRPGAAGHRRDHRHRHLRAHRTLGRQIRRARGRAVVRRRRHRLGVRRALLRRDGVDDPDRRQRVHLLVRDDGRARRLGHRLGLDPGVRDGRRDGQRRLVGLRGRVRPRLHRHQPARGLDAPRRSSTTRRPAVHAHRRVPQRAGDVHHAAGDGHPRHRHQGVGALQRGHRVRQARRRRRVHRLGRALRAPRELAPVHSARTKAPGRFGFSGIMRGAASVFFAYIGFDAVSTAAQETKNPQTRSADRHPGVAGDLHRALHRERRWC